MATNPEIQMINNFVELQNLINDIVRTYDTRIIPDICGLFHQKLISTPELILILEVLYGFCYDRLDREDRTIIIPGVNQKPYILIDQLYENYSLVFFKSFQYNNKNPEKIECVEICFLDDPECCGFYFS